MITLIYFIVGVDDPKTNLVETSVQLPTSSSNAEKQSSTSVHEDKPGKYNHFSISQVLFLGPVVR